MKSTVEPLEGNKVKVSVEVDEAEFEKDIDAAFRKLAREARIPGFRPGKAPRRVMEARVGKEVGRQQALQDGLPDYYVQAVKEHAVDVIAPPDFELTGGEADGPVSFDAVVEVRPVIIVPGYKSLEITIDSYLPTDEEIHQQIDRLRERFATNEVVERPAADGDTVLIDIVGIHEDEEIPGITTDDYSFTIGGTFPVPEVHEHLTGASAGDTLEFEAPFPNQTIDDDDPDNELKMISFSVTIKEVTAKVLPELDDSFADEASEFPTLVELREGLVASATRVKKARAANSVEERTFEALANLVEEEPPEPMVAQETQNHIQQWLMQLQAQGIDPGMFLQITGQSEADIVAENTEKAIRSVKCDLALRAIVDAEEIEVDDDDVAEEIDALALRTGEKASKIRKQFERDGRMEAVRSDLRIRKAFDWLCDNVLIFDADGNRIERASLEPDEDPDEVAQDEVNDDTVTDSASDDADAGTTDHIPARSDSE